MTKLETALEIKKNNYNCDYCGATIQCYQCPLEDMNCPLEDMNCNTSCGYDRDNSIKNEKDDEEYLLRKKLIDDFIKDGINPMQKTFLESVKKISEASGFSCDDISCTQCPFDADEYQCGGERDRHLEEEDDEDYLVRRKNVLDYLQKKYGTITTQPTTQNTLNEGVVIRSGYMFQSPKKYYRLIKVK